MRDRLMSLGTCVVLALGMASFWDRPQAASDRTAEGRSPTPQALSELLSAWPGAAPVDAQDFRAEATDRQTHTLVIGPNGSLELKTVSGDITCIAGSGSSATVEVIRRSRGRTDADARLGLAEVRAAVDRQGERATVRAVYPDNRRQPPYSVEVTYVVTAPAGTRIDAGSVSGDVSVQNVRGDVNVSSVSGEVSVDGGGQVSAAKSVSGNVSIRNTTSSGDVSVGSVSGDVRIDQVRAVRLDAQSVSGSIVAHRVTVEGTNLKSVSGVIEFSGPFTAGGRYEFQSHSGDVRVTREGNTGFDLQLSTFSGSLRADPVLNMKTARGSFRGTVGDGSAILVATTFSGNVTVVTR